jgi:hypothetical protein
MTLALAWVLSATMMPAHDEGFPEATLKAIFPSATGFTPRQRAFTTSQVKQIEQAAASKLARNDNPLRFYVALGKAAVGSGVLGTVVMVDASGPKGMIDIALGVKRDGTIERVVITENTDEKELSDPAFLDQLKGKNAQSPLMLGKDVRHTGSAESAQAVLSAIRRALQMLSVATGK